MTEKKRGLSRFAKGLLIYILLFALLAAAALCVLRSYLAAYEKSRPAACVRSYLNEAADGKLGYGWGRCLAGLDSRMQSEEESLAWVKDELSKASFREMRSEREKEKCYAITDENGVILAKLTLRPGEEGRWGFTPWQVVGEECDLSAYTHSVEAVVPEGYGVRVDGVELGSESISERGISYEMLEPFEEYLHNPPKLQRYACGPFLGEGRVEILDPKGQVVPEEKQNEQSYLANCSKDEEERLHEFVLRYLNVYLPYAGDLYRSGLAFYGELSQMIVTGGELEQRLILARNGFGFGNTNSLRILSDSINFCMKFDDNHYLVDISYRTETEGLAGLVEEDNRMRLLILERDGFLYTESMVNY